MSASIIDAIGNTPLVEITRMNPVSGVKIYAKLEYMNPGGSIKDRAALFMINSAEASGELTPEKTVIEATSGNTGIGLAMICAVRGYRIALTMAENASEERKSILRARGAKIILTPQHLGSDGAIEEAYRLARENPDKYFLTDQYNNDANWQAHFHTTGPEILEQTDGRVSSVVATVGTSGTLMGLSAYFRMKKPDVRVVCAEPYLGHRIQGLKNMKESYTPEIFDKSKLDRVTYIDDDTAFETARQLARQEGLFVGMSSGGAVAAAIEEAKRIKQGVVVAILPDSGERYLSTPLFSVTRKVNLRLFNSLTHEKQRFEPLKPDKISVYTCGPTVFKRLPVARFRRYVYTDILVRYLEFHNMAVNHVVNITDYDDKTIQGASRAGVSVDKFTRPHIERYKQDLADLGVRTAQAYPRVSDHFTEMTDLTRTLLSKGHAYEKLHSVYFDISSVPEYGQLSKVDINKIRLGATVDLDEYEKLNPRDFTLFKRVKLSELKQGIGLKTEWGNVRPSLHLQCAAMSMAFHGNLFDIHTGSRELIFPHHENEMAIARAAGGSGLANVWLHCNPVHTDGSLGTDTIEEVYLDTLADRGWDAKTVRFWLMSGHYRKNLVLSEQALSEAGATLGRINRCISTLGEIRDGEDYPETDQLIYDLRQGVGNALADDLKITNVVSSILAFAKKINSLMSQNRISPDNAQKLMAGFREVDGVLNIFDFSEKMEYSRDVRGLIRERDDARARQDWETADQLRDRLEAMGIRVHDKKAGK